MIKNVYWSSGKVHFILVRSQYKFNYLDSFSKNSQILNSMQILLVGAELFHADRRTDVHDKADSRFSQFCESA